VKSVTLEYFPNLSRHEQLVKYACVTDSLIPRAAIALTNDDSDLALAGLVASEAAVNAVLSEATRLKKHGLNETRDSIAAKLKRGTFAATFLLGCLAALEMEGIRLEDI
jgi:hypothetical protein